MRNLRDKKQLIDDLIRQNSSNAICYSGYRAGQDPRQQIFPTYEEIREDLLLLAPVWSFIRLYDSSPHAATTLKVIRDEGLEMQVMLGVDLAAEVSNPACPWGGVYDAETLARNRQKNSADMERLIELATEYADIVFAVSIGNEASVSWTDHMVPVSNLVAYARRLKKALSQPVTFCENYVPWTNKLRPLVAELDFISVHTYPVWEYRTVGDALEYSKQNYYSVADNFPDKPVVITEAGWPTASNGRGIDPHNASEELQTEYCRQLLDWVQTEGILTFVFEAFDEPWKGSPHPDEPEKHWGVYYLDRTPKPFMRDLLQASF